ncbi:MAG: phosphatase [Coriobacteriia bacterium]|nr:phosphatase [Coriobacteriia bacterium]
MRLLADLHTHTVASGHAYSTVSELSASAATRGLELIAVTDHGPGVPDGPHPWYFWNLKVLPSVLGGVRILKGVEANPSMMTENGIDLPDELLSVLDLVAVGLHPLSGFDERDEVKNTEAVLRAITNPYVDVLVHPGNDDFPTDLDAVVACALEHDVIIELNAHSFDATSSRSASGRREREYAQAAFDSGALMAIGSDAHFHLHVGRFDGALSVAEEIGITEDRLVNRDAETVLAHLLSKRDRPRLNAGGEW